MDVPLEAFLLPLDLEARGFHLTPGGECALVVRPYQHLTPEDFRHIRRWRSGTYWQCSNTTPRSAPRHRAPGVICLSLRRSKTKVGRVLPLSVPLRQVLESVGPRSPLRRPTVVVIRAAARNWDRDASRAARARGWPPHRRRRE